MVTHEESVALPNKTKTQTLGQNQTAAVDMFTLVVVNNGRLETVHAVMINRDRSLFY